MVESCRSREWGGDDATFADEMVDVWDFDPAFGFGGFGFEFGGGFDRVTGDGDFGVGGIEFEGGVFGAGKGAVGFLVEASGDGFDGGGEEVVEFDFEVVDGEAGFGCT